jgi:hypothetical protein
MKPHSWLLAVAACVRERQFWNWALKDTLDLITNPSSGLGVALTAAVIGIVRRILQTAHATVCLQVSASMREPNKASRRNAPGNANA